MATSHAFGVSKTAVIFNQWDCSERSSIGAHGISLVIEKDKRSPKEIEIMRKKFMEGLEEIQLLNEDTNYEDNK